MSEFSATHWIHIQTYIYKKRLVLKPNYLLSIQLCEALNINSFNETHIIALKSLGFSIKFDSSMF